jgi:hypothetical protein
LGYDAFSNIGRDVAQPGSAPEWGSGGREFESPRPDQLSELPQTPWLL